MRFKKRARIITASVLLLAILVTGIILLFPKDEYDFGKNPKFTDETGTKWETQSVWWNL